jgi:hypothetical protein
VTQGSTELIVTAGDADGGDDDDDDDDADGGDGPRTITF